jgi:hypothetical protein
MKAYECAGEDERKRMLRTILEAWDAEYQSLISFGVSSDDIWNIGARQIGEIIATDGADECN